jgi:hypothetical protein
MRFSRFFLAAGLGFLMCACSSGPSRAPTPFHKERLIGKWTAVDKHDFVQGLEFTADNTVNASFHGMEGPVPGKYSWTGERVLEVEFQVSPEIKQAYQKAAKQMQDRIRQEAVKGGKKDMDVEKYAMEYPDELPPKVTFRLNGLTDEKPSQLIVDSELAFATEYRKAQ